MNRSQRNLSNQTLSNAAPKRLRALSASVLCLSCAYASCTSLGNDPSSTKIDPESGTTGSVTVPNGSLVEDNRNRIRICKEEQGKLTNGGDTQGAACLGVLIDVLEGITGEVMLDNGANYKDVQIVWHRDQQSGYENPCGGINITMENSAAPANVVLDESSECTHPDTLYNENVGVCWQSGSIDDTIRKYYVERNGASQACRKYIRKT